MIKPIQKQINWIQGGRELQLQRKKIISWQIQNTPLKKYKNTIIKQMQKKIHWILGGRELQLQRTNLWQIARQSNKSNSGHFCNRIPNYLTKHFHCIVKITHRDIRGGICPCRHCRRQCKIFASGVNFSIFTHGLCFFPLKLLKLGEIDGVKFLAWKSGGVNFWTNSMSVTEWSQSKVYC